MPAVRWEAIRQEAQALVAHSGDPEAFVAAWEALLTRHADRTFRRGQAVVQPRLPTYHLPPAVLAAVWQVLRGHLAARPSLVLPLADRLWARPDLESRLLAARLLGLAETTPPEPLLQRFWAWLEAAPAPEVAEALLQFGTARLVHEAPAAYLNAAAQALADPKRAGLGLKALLPLVQAPKFENLPRVLKLLTPLLTPPDAELRPELTAVLQALVSRWPEEMLPYLRSTWHTSPSPLLAWLIRRVLPRFSPEQAQSLQQLLRS